MSLTLELLEMVYKRLINYLIAFMLLVPPTAAFAENIDPGNDGSQYAWGENIGWLNLEPSYGPGITVTNTAVTGYAWGENIGWINFSPASGGVLNDGYGNLSGYAWSENVGWINFAPTAGGVWIDSNGIFQGYAWGENIGWINFAPASGGVKTSWRLGADNCSDAKQITVFDYTDTMDTTTATSAAGDPAVCAGSKGNTVWYKYTAIADGTVTADTIGSNYDTVLAAYTGTCGNFSSVACDDDGGGNLTSSVTFNVTAGTTYYFMVAGYWNPGGGQLTFNLLQSICTTIYYQDLDNDGFGNPNSTTTACTQPPGYVTNNTDCDDTNEYVHPNAAETCNDVDDDCDGQIDEGLKTTYYQDLDEDGYGNPNVSWYWCTQPGLITDNTDCDDNDPNIYPGGPPARVVGSTTNYYSTVQAAYNGASDGNAIQIKNTSVLNENMSINRNITVTMTGGYDCAYSTAAGKTAIIGNLTISNGKVTIENIELQK